MDTRTDETIQDNAGEHVRVLNYGTISSVQNPAGPQTVVYVAGGESFNMEPSQNPSELSRQPLHIISSDDDTSLDDVIDSPQDSDSAIPYFIITSNIKDKDPAVQAEKIVEEFNRQNKGPKALTQSNAFTFWRGKRIKRYEFMLAHHNFQPELATYSPNLLVATSSMFDWTFHSEILGFHWLSQRFFGNYGRYVLQVWQSEYAKVIKDGEYLLYDEGVHIISSANIVFNIATDFVKKSVDHIQHGSIHVLHVPVGKYAKVEKGGALRLFSSRNKPYICNDDSFKFDGYVNTTEKYFEFKGLKYINPGVNEVAIIRHQGQLLEKKARKDGKPILLSSPTDTFEGFVSSELQTLEYPSEAAKNKKLEQKFLSKDEDICFNYFITLDKFKIGIKTSIEYVILYPLNIIEKGIAITKIAEYIETRTTAILKNFISTYEWTKILSSTNSSRNNTPPAPLKPLPNVILETQPVPIMNTIEDTLAWELTTEFTQMGIEFKGLNFDIHNTVDTMARLAIGFWRPSDSLSGTPPRSQITSPDASQSSSGSFNYQNNK